MKPTQYNFDDIHARVPVNRTAILRNGAHYIPKKKILVTESETPMRTTPITKCMRRNATFVDVTGVRFGRFVVLGLSADYQGRWVVRCDCGTYTIRRKKAITNPSNDMDRCETCRNLLEIKRNYARSK